MTTTNHNTFDLTDRKADDLARIKAVIEKNKDVLPFKMIRWDMVPSDRWHVAGDWAFVDLGHFGALGEATLRMHLNVDSHSLLLAPYDGGMVGPNDPAINYRDLLRKYIAHVQYCEGSDCVTWRKPSAADEVQFTPQELEELKRLSEEKI